MFILIEIDRDWTVGVDWHKRSWGFRLGFIAIHLCIDKHKDFVGKIADYYAEEKIKQLQDRPKAPDPTE